VAETLLITLYVRAQETQRPDALLKDEKAVALVARLGPAIDRIQRVQMDDEDRASIMLRAREIDNMTRAFLAGHAEPTVAYLNCGLDSRFERVDDGRVEWYDLDLASVIDLRRKLLGGDTARHHLLSGSAFDQSWFSALGTRGGGGLLFLAEGLFQYFTESQVRPLVIALRQHFPGSELIFDAFSPFIVRMNNLRMLLSRMGARYGWGLRKAADVEQWADGIRLIEEWFPFSRPEPRLAKFQWARNIPLIAKTMGVYHFRLGEAAR
jgi:O-methyltransferase involved in polyketide biosynthesis